MSKNNRSDSKVIFADDDDVSASKVALLATDGSSLTQSIDCCGTKPTTQLYGSDDVSLSVDCQSTINSTQSSATTRRPRTQSTIAKERDEQMIEEEARVGFCKRYKPLFVLIPYMLLQDIGGVFISPILPGIYKDYFGSDERAAEIVSYITAGTALVGMFTCAFYGKLLDTIGRKPFFVLAPLMQTAIPNLLLAIFPSQPILYMASGAVGNLIQGSFATSYVADCFSSKSRVKVFAVVEAVGTVSALFAIFAGFLSNTVLIILGCIMSFGSVLYALVFIKETIPDEIRRPLSIDLFTTNPFSSMAFLLKSKVCRAVVAIIACFLFGQVGTADIYMFYFNERVGFNKTDNGIFMAEYGILTPIILLIVLPLLAKRLSPTLIIFISMAALLVELVIVATIWAKWPVFAFVVPLFSLTLLMTPILLAVISNSGNPADQGRRLTGFAAIVDLCEAGGPLVFGAVYGNVSATLSFIPFIVAAAFVFPAIFVTLRLPRYIQEDECEREAQVADAVSRGRSASTVNSLVREDRRPPEATV